MVSRGQQPEQLLPTKQLATVAWKNRFIRENGFWWSRPRTLSHEPVNRNETRVGLGSLWIRLGNRFRIWRNTCLSPTVSIPC